MERGHYATAMRAWLPLANAGIAQAQNNMGHTYEEGLGVAQNYTTALDWYRKAADSGLAEAQQNVGDATNLPYEKDEFDYNYSIGSLEHFTEEGILKFLK